MTQPQIAEVIADDEIKMNGDGISNLVRNETRPTVKLLIKLAKLTGIPVIILVEGDVEAQDIPKKPLVIGEVEGGENPYEQNNWRRLKVEDFFARSQEMYLEMKSFKERLLEVESKLDAIE